MFLVNNCRNIYMNKLAMEFSVDEFVLTKSKNRHNENLNENQWYFTN